MKAAVTCLLFLSGAALAQPADTFDPRSRDEAHVAALSGPNGASATAGRVTVYVPAGSLSGEELTTFAEMLNGGFSGLVAFTHSPRSWQRLPSKVSYYVHAETLISHADPERDRQGDPLGRGTLADVDAKCAAVSSTPLGAEILPFIGAPGFPAALLSRSRWLEVAPPYYARATSFTKFVVVVAGIEAVLDAMAVIPSEPAIASAAGKGIEELRAEWRKAIGAS